MKYILLLVALPIFFISCGGNTSEKQAISLTQQSDVTEVLYFHGKRRCITCNAIEKLTKEVIDSLANEKVVIKIIDISQKKNEAMAEKYEVTWSALKLDRNGRIENLTDMGFNYAKRQPEVFKEKLVEAINNIAK